MPGGDAGLAHLSDRELLARTRELVGRSNQIFATLLAHLAEIGARGLHRTRACASIYTYCIYELRFSEDAAARRAGAAKLVKRFPLLLPAIANGELHLTGLLMLGPHFTPDNVVEVRPRAAVHELALDAAPRATGGKIAGAPHSTGGGRSRHVPAAVRRAVYERDSARCTFIDGRGERCRETHGLELHHRQPFGKQGAHTAANLTLHCRTHNGLAAESDFGRQHMAQRQQPGRHESLAAERRAAKRTTGEPD